MYKIELKLPATVEELAATAAEGAADGLAEVNDVFVDVAMRRYGVAETDACLLFIAAMKKELDRRCEPLF